MSDPTREYSITLSQSLAEAARRLERDNLAEPITAAEAEHGSLSEEEIREKQDLLRRAHEQRHTDGTGAR